MAGIRQGIVTIARSQCHLLLKKKLNKKKKKKKSEIHVCTVAVLFFDAPYLIKRVVMSALSDPKLFPSAGQKLGIELWRIENRAPVPIEVRLSRT